MALGAAWVRDWARQYAIDYDRAIEELAGRKQIRYDDVLRVVRWKSGRSVGYFRRKESYEVGRALTKALRVNDDEGALRTMLSLHGIQERVGSAILAAYRPNRFTVMDARAWSSLIRHGYLKEDRVKSWLDAWVPYLRTTRDLAARFRVDLRTLDRALWSAAGRTGLPTRGKS